MLLPGYFCRHTAKLRVHRHGQDHSHPLSLFSSQYKFPRFFFIWEPRMTSCLNVWELISISKGWGRQGRKPKTQAKAPVSFIEPGIQPSKPGLGWGLHCMDPTQAAPSLLCSAPGVHTNRTQKSSTSAHTWISNAQMEGCMAGFSLTAPGAQPLVFVIISLCGSNNSFIFSCASPQRELARLMYISGLCKDILDSHEF